MPEAHWRDLEAWSRGAGVVTLVEQESPKLKFGKDLMVRVKLNELVKLRYLP